VESEVAKAAEANPIIPGLLHHQQLLAEGELQTPQYCAWKDEELTVQPARYSHPVTYSNFVLLSFCKRSGTLGKIFWKHNGARVTAK
jgi:hypothetical protein